VVVHPYLCTLNNSGAWVEVRIFGVFLILTIFMATAGENRKMGLSQSIPGWKPPSGRHIIKLMNRIYPLCLIFLSFLAASICSAQDSSSRASQAPNAAIPVASPTPEARSARRRTSPEVEEAMNRGRELLFKKHDAKAGVEEFKKVIKLDPWFGDGYLLLGLAHMQLQHWSEAQWAFEEVAKVEPGNAQAYLGTGAALNEQKDYAGAQKALQHSLELQPDSAEAHYELARSLCAMGKWEAAEPHVSMAIEINKDYAGPHVLMGNIYLQHEDPDGALAEFKEYLRLDPQGNLAASVKDMVSQLEKALAAK
jgi:tetratricopeptide (TPR) repeat protein